MNFTQYAPLALRTNASRGRDDDHTHALIGICTEIGELADNVKRNFRYGKELDKVNGGEEIADICWYINLYCDSHRIHPSVLDDALAKMRSEKRLPPDSLVERVLALWALMAMLAVPEEEREGAPSQGIIEVTVCALAHMAEHDFDTTIEACLDLNIAKLAKRYGERYSDFAALHRDTAAERQILEGNAG